jgi:hypothetical protein
MQGSNVVSFVLKIILNSRILVGLYLKSVWYFKFFANGFDKNVFLIIK